MRPKHAMFSIVTGVISVVSSPTPVLVSVDLVVQEEIDLTCI